MGGTLRKGGSNFSHDPGRCRWRDLVAEGRARREQPHLGARGGRRGGGSSSCRRSSARRRGPGRAGGCHRPAVSARASPTARPRAFPIPCWAHRRVSRRAEARGSLRCGTCYLPERRLGHSGLGQGATARLGRWSVRREPGSGTATGEDAASIRVPHGSQGGLRSFIFSDSAYAGLGKRLTSVFSFLAKKRRK